MLKTIREHQCQPETSPKKTLTTLGYTTKPILFNVTLQKRLGYESHPLLRAVMGCKVTQHPAETAWHGYISRVLANTCNATTELGLQVLTNMYFHSKISIQWSPVYGIRWDEEKRHLSETVSSKDVFKENKRKENQPDGSLQRKCYLFKSPLPASTVLGSCSWTDCTWWLRPNWVLPFCLN